MKNCVLLVLCLSLALVLSGCGCDHDWQQADCLTPKICTLSGKTEGAVLAHSWQEADCEHSRACSGCGQTQGEPKGHQWQAATCIALETCMVCGQTRGELAEHRWTSVTCTDPGVCAVCGEKGTELAEHALTEATCVSLAACRVCGESVGYLADHVFDMADGTTLGSCTLCGYSINDSFLAHELFFGNTCAALIGTWTAQWQAGGDSVGLKGASKDLQIEATVTVKFTGYGKFTMQVSFDKDSYLAALDAYNKAGDAAVEPVADAELTRRYEGTYYWYADALCGFDGEDAVLVGTVTTKVEQEFTVDTESMGTLTFVKQN